MTKEDVRFVLDSSEGLSARARHFLRSEARRLDFDPGLVGDELRKRIIAVYGNPNERMVGLLDELQGRYGGLAYRSGFFDANVAYTPMCEPEDADEELEILYVVQTGTSAGASVRADGTVVVGFDQWDVVEFRTLDALLECDSMFTDVTKFASVAEVRVSAAGLAGLADYITAETPFSLQLVSEACGSHTFWFSGEEGAVFLCGTWSGMGFPMPPTVKVWSDDDRLADTLRAAYGVLSKESAK
ncbi:hypothetical protein [Kibdelosporangium persicum]|uniref:hypothetical protein n=1 Tax=Kibdelosporangium persicum TaxID=2698649 RepID=UPI0015665B49|nr:hypothetical protein [Kibdelosporangium persicum]